MAQATPDYGVLAATPQTSRPQARWMTDSAWAIVANLSQAAGPFLGLILISQTHGLGAAGRFAFAQALTTPIILLLSFQLKALLLTHEVAELSTASAVGIRALSSALGLAVTFGLLIWVSPLAGLLMASRLVDSWAELFQADQQRNGRMWRAGSSAFARACCFLAAIAATASAEEGVAAYVLLSLFLLLVFDLDSSGFGFQFDPTIWKTIFRRGSVLAGAMFLQALQASIPRLVLGHFASEAALGSFATLCVILQTGNLIASAFGQGLLPFLGDAPIRRIVIWAGLPAAVAVIVLGATLLAGDLPLVLFHIPVHPEARRTILALSLSQLVVWPAAMLGYALTARRIYGQQIYLALGLNVVSAASSLLLIPRFGAPGAAVTLGMTSAVTLAAAFVLLRRNSTLLEVR